MKKILVITNIPSYHQVELFNEICKSKKISFKVYYLINKTVDRHWKKDFKIKHDHNFLKTTHLLKNKGVYYNKGILKNVKKENPDIIVLTQYANISQQILLYYYWLKRNRVSLKFWSEKPGISFYEVPIVNSNFLRTIFRKISLVPILNNRKIQIWGIGSKAVNYFTKRIKSEVVNFPYFLDTKRFDNSKKRDFNGKLKILYAGKFNKRKGFDILLSFLENTEKEFLNNFEFTLLGTGEYMNRVNELDKKRDNVTYKSFVERQSMPEYYSKHDLFLFPGRYDGWGMVVNEAMASGLVIVASKAIGAIEDVVLDRANGILIEENVNSIKLKLSWVISNRESLHSISENAKKTSLKNDVKAGSKLFLKLLN
mgnify:CR=1 FL=1